MASRSRARLHGSRLASGHALHAACRLLGGGRPRGTGELKLRDAAATMLGLHDPAQTLRAFPQARVSFGLVVYAPRPRA
jgi:hypothetical protein